MKTHILLFAAGLGCLGATGAFALDREAALGPDGEVYLVRAETYADLFPAKNDAPHANPILALEVTQPDKAPLRLLVPGTEGPEVERSSSVLYEDDSNTVFVLWQSDVNFHPVLKLAAYDGAKWSEPIEVTSNPFAPKTAPQFTLTRDTYQEKGADGTEITRHRTILHLLWQEEVAPGNLGTLYTPVVLNDGVYIGWNPVYTLDDYVQTRLAGVASAEIQPSVTRAPVIHTGRDERTVVIAYTSPRLGRLVTIEVDVLPEELSRLADGVRAHIIDLGRDLYPLDLTQLSGKVRAHIIDLGRAFRSEVIRSVADQASAKILNSSSSQGLQSLAADVRAHIIDLGAQFSGRGLRGNNGADETAKIIEVDTSLGLPEFVPGGETHLLQFRIVSSFPAPRVGPGVVRLFVSEAGEDAIVSWAQNDRVLYRNSQDSGGWSNSKELRFANDLDLAKAYEILEQRIRNR